MTTQLQLINIIIIIIIIKKDFVWWSFIASLSSGLKNFVRTPSCVGISLIYGRRFAAIRQSCRRRNARLILL